MVPPAPERADPALRRVPGLRPVAARAHDGRGVGLRIAVIVATIGNTLGSLVAYAIGAYGGRPFLERYGRYLLIRQHAIDLADRFFERWGRITVFVSRLLPVVRTFISFPAGVVRMPLRPFIIYSTAGAFLLVHPARVGRRAAGRQLGRSREMLQPFDTLMIVLVILAGVLFLWWRIGTPGLPRRRQADDDASASQDAPVADEPPKADRETSR